MHLLAPLATALLLVFSAAPFHLGVPAVVALVPLVCCAHLSGRRRFLLGWAAGFLLQAGAYTWIVVTIRDFGGVSTPLSLLSAVLFWAFQGLDIGLWLWLFPLISGRAAGPLRAPLAAACWYLLQTRLFPYIFPWIYGSFLVEPAVLARGAALWGDQGVGFLLVWFQVALCDGPRTPSGFRRYSALLPLALFGAAYLVPRPVHDATLRVAAVQPNIIPWAKREGASALEVFLAHYERSLPLAGRNLDLILWPETAVPFPLNGSGYYENKMRELATATGAAVVAGALERDAEGRYYNAIFLYAPGVEAPQIYRKHKLVPFSEDLPWFLRWALAVVPQLGGFTPGEGYAPLTYKGVRIIPLVCYEALYAGYVARYDGHLMVNVTNDAWFGPTKAAAQHLQEVRMRTVEHGIPLVRAANSGISCWVDTDGRVHDATEVYTEALPIFEVAYPTRIPAKPVTVTAPLLTVASLLLTAGGTIAALRRRRGAPTEAAA